MRESVGLSLAEFGALPAATLTTHKRLHSHPANLARTVKRVLKQTGFSMKQISALTGARFGNKSPSFIPMTFVFKIKTGVSPHICQVAALGGLTGYPFSYWMRVFGFDLSLIRALQLKLHPAVATIYSGPQPDQVTLSKLISISRSRCGLTLRRAHGLSVQIGELLHDRNCAIAIGQLSDYEAMDKLPRHIAKVVTLSIIYAIDLQELMKSAGIILDNMKTSKTEQIFRYNPHPASGRSLSHDVIDDQKQTRLPLDQQLSSR